MMIPISRVSEPALDGSASSMSDSIQRVRAELSLSDGSKQHRHQGVAAFEFHTMSVTSVSKHCGNSSGEMVGTGLIKVTLDTWTKWGKGNCGNSCSCFPLSLIPRNLREISLRAFPTTRVKVLRDSATCSTPLLVAGSLLHFLPCHFAS